MGKECAGSAPQSPIGRGPKPLNDDPGSSSVSSSDDLPHTSTESPRGPIASLQVGEIAVEVADSTPKKTRKRFVSVDVFRAGLIVFMIFNHCLEYISDPTGSVYDVLDKFSFICAPGFSLLSGACQTQSSTAELGIWTALWKAVRRAFVLMVVQAILSLIDWLWADNYDVLTLLACQAILLVVFVKFPRKIRIYMAALFIIIGPMLRKAAQYDTYMDIEEGEFYIDVHSPAWVFFTAFFVNGYFPLFPWMAFPLYGTVVGEDLLRQGKQKPLRVLWHCIGCLALGTTLIIGYYVQSTRDTEDPAAWFTGPFELFPPTPSMCFLMLGAAMLIFLALYWFLDSSDEKQKTLFYHHCCPKSLLGSYISLMSRFSLTVFFLQYVTLNSMGRICEAKMGDYDPNLPLIAALGCGVLQLAFCSGIVFIWDRFFQGRFSCEWLLAKISK